MPSGIYKHYQYQGFQKGHNIGHQKKSQKTKEKIRKSLENRFLSEEHKRNIGKALEGEKSFFWKGGISFEPYPIGWTNGLKESIRKRDNYVCQLCGIHQDELKGWYRKLDIHHIDYDKNNLDPNNLISLCRSCHRKTNHNRDYWISYFHTGA